jgi:hypothetical protein
MNFSFTDTVNEKCFIRGISKIIIELINKDFSWTNKIFDLLMNPNPKIKLNPKG